jgi:phosphoribosylformimino-5-aminoimidazole carboxamide ribotide isomerase
MRVIPVIDLKNGLVVRGVAGRRKEYRPIESRIAADARPATVARAFVREFGFNTAYVADLDAIVHGRPDVTAWQQVAAAGMRLWLDAGIGTSQAARRTMGLVAQARIEADLVVGLESLESEAEFIAITEVCAGRPPIFSLDMQSGRLLVRNPAWRNLSPVDLVLLAKSAGVRDVLVLDLADVGTSAGTRTLDLCRQIRPVADGQRLIAGGGVRGLEDLRAMADAGVGAALVASALHDGRLTSEEVRQVENLPHE